MKRILTKLRILYFRYELHVLTNSLHHHRAPRILERKAISFLMLGVIGMNFILLILMFAVGLKDISSMIGISKIFIAVVLCIPFVVLIWKGERIHRRVKKNGDLNEVEIWELQNKTQAKLKALTDA